MKTYWIIPGTKTAHTVYECHYLQRSPKLAQHVSAKRLPNGFQWCEECERLEKKAKKQ